LIEVPQNKTLLQQWPVLIEDLIETFHTKKQPNDNQKQEVVSFDNKTNMQLRVEDLDDGVPEEGQASHHLLCTRNIYRQS